MPNTTHWQASVFKPPDADKLGEPLPTALARVAAVWPNNPAVLHGDQRHSFTDLVQRATQLAQAIHASAAPPGPVALLQSAGLDAVAAWFACAMTGRPFLLLEPSHPALRLHELMDAAGATLVLCDATTVHSLLPQGQAKPLNICTQHGANHRPAAVIAPNMLLDVQAPAMVFPTSGSTGTPKLVTYAAYTLQVKLQASMRLMRVPAGAKVLIAGSHGNYGFLHHAMVFLLSGGALCLTDVKAGGFSAISDAILSLGARHVRFTPSMFRTFAPLPEAQTALRCLEAVRFSGEPLLRSDLDLAQTVLKPDCLIQNVYGSTESALFIWSLGDEIDASATVPMGHIYPLSSYALKPLDDGTPDAPDTGELLIRSANHALGDLKAGIIDPERFVPDALDATEAIYATGDIVRRLPGGGLVHLGRTGRMVKIRGQRVFLTEIENHLRTMPGVTGAAVVEQIEHNSPALYGFITVMPNTATAPLDARQWLASCLPGFMTPRRVLTVPEIPLLAGGKVDHHALLAQVPVHLQETHAVQPPAGDHSHLAQAWDTVLGTGFHRLEDDFFALGGDSLKLMELSLEVERVFGHSFPTEAFLNSPTLPKLAGLLGIDWPQVPAVIQEGIRLRPAWSSPQPSRGIVLSMPSMRGSALTRPFTAAGLFPDHDLWAADFGLKEGNLMQDKRWWRCAQDIAQQLQEGAMPAPRALIGHSIGGSIAWLVARLLAGTAQCPGFVILIDAAPLHRLHAHRHRALNSTLAALSNATLPPMLHIRRAPLVSAGTGTGNSTAWQLEDSIQTTIDLPTVSHLEMARGDVLAIAAQATRAFLNAEPNAPSSIASRPAAELEVDGVRLYSMHTSDHANKNGMLKAFIQNMPAKLDHHGFLALFHLALRDSGFEQAQAVLQMAITQHPASRLFRYAQYRLGRNPQTLCPNDTPKYFPINVVAFEKALAIHRSHHRGSTPPRWLRQLWQAVDMAWAFVAVVRDRRQSRKTH